MGETAAYQRLHSTSEEEGDYQCLPSEEEEEVYYRHFCALAHLFRVHLVHLAPIFVVYGEWVNLSIVSALHLVL